jgi:hypothetical protein
MCCCLDYARDDGDRDWKLWHHKLNLIFLSHPRCWCNWVDINLCIIMISSFSLISRKIAKSPSCMCCVNYVTHYNGGGKLLFLSRLFSLINLWEFILLNNSGSCRRFFVIVTQFDTFAALLPLKHLFLFIRDSF